MKNLLLLTMLTFGLSAHSQILIKFNNQTDKDIQIKVTYGEATSPTESFVEVFTQNIDAHTDNPVYTKLNRIKKNKKIYVTGTIAGIGNFKFEEMTVARKNQKVDINLKINANAVPSDNHSYQVLMDQLNYTPPEKSQKVLAADVAYKAYFGGLSLRKDSIEVGRIEPTVLKSEITPIQFGSINTTIELFFSGNYISKNNGTVPGIGSVNLDVSRDEIYKLKYNIADIGTQVWSGAKSVDLLFHELDGLERNALIKRYLADTTLQLFQYDHMHLFKSLILNVDKYKRTSTIIDANVPVFFSTGSAFKKEEGESFATSSYATVLNIWATKDVTYLLVQATQEYLEKQREFIRNSTTTRDAQIVIEAAQLTNDAELLNFNANMSKGQIQKELETKIEVLKDKNQSPDKE